MNMIIDEYKDDFGTEYESLFWFALAKAQWKKGRLIESVRDKALFFLDQASDLARWDTPDEHKNYLLRKKELEKLRITLESPQPPRMKIRKPTGFHSPWKVGDLLAFKIMESESSPDEKYIGKYVLIRVVRINRKPFNKRVESGFFNDRVYFSMYGWMGDSVPNPDIVKNLNYIFYNKHSDVLRGYMEETCFDYFVNYKEIKQREIVVIENDANFSKKDLDFFDLRITRCPSINNNIIDFCLCKAYKLYLKELAEKLNS